MSLELATIAQPVFDRQGWAYGGLGLEPEYIPSREELAALIEELAREILTGAIISAESGRIRCEWDDDDEQVVVLLELGRIDG